MRVLIISGRDEFSLLSDACAYDAEDVAVQTLQADLLTRATDPATLAPGYDLVMVFAISFLRLDTIKAWALPLVQDRLNGPMIGYVFGGYGSLVKPSDNPIKRAFGKAGTRFRVFDRMYVGIEDDVSAIAASINVDTAYVPMAARVLDVAATPFRGGPDRPISVNAFGRQKMPVVEAIADALNTPDSDGVLYATNFLGVGDTRDLWRYRAMFWQLLRKSRVAMCFDQFYANDGDAKLSYVGPRWFEALAAGTVIVGRVPPTRDSGILLDWPDAAIDLPDDAIAARDVVLALLQDEARLMAASRANLHNMAVRHDWAHRIATMLDREGLDAPDGLRARLDALSRFAADLA